MKIRQIAELYLHGLKLREQAHQLSQKNLAKKFEHSRRTIGKIANRMPCQVPEDEQALIRECLAERDRLKSKAAEISMPRLCHLHGIGHKAIEDELYLMGAREIAA